MPQQNIPALVGAKQTQLQELDCFWPSVKAAESIITHSNHTSHRICTVVAPIDADFFILATNLKNEILKKSGAESFLLQGLDF